MLLSPHTHAQKLTARMWAAGRDYNTSDRPTDPFFTFVAPSSYPNPLGP